MAKKTAKKLIVLLCLVAVFAVPAYISAASVTQGYKASTDVPIGAVVSLTDSGSEVEKTTIENDSRGVGVIVDESSALVDVQPAGSQVRVAISGDIKILVSTLNGDIRMGDKLIATPLAGIAGVDYPPAPGVKYIAVAEADFNTTTEGADKTQITQTDGSKKEVSIGLIPAKMLLGSRESTQSQNLLSKIGKQITGKDTSIIQVLAAISIFITTVVLAGVVLHGSIRGTFISLGRNPMSKDSILTGLVRVIVVAIVILGAGAIVAYLILNI